MDSFAAMPAQSNIQTLAQTVYRHLWRKIEYMELAPGARLSEAQIARDFDCSRIPVREAVRRLVAEDALEVRPQRGSFVTLIDLDQLERIRYLREALECKIILDGFREHCFDGVLPYLDSIVQRQADLLASSCYEEAFELDMEFHKVFYSLAHKEFVLAHTGESDIHYMRARLLSLHLESTQMMVCQHAAIVDALRARDEAALQRALEAHLKNVNQVFRTGRCPPGYLRERSGKL